MMVLLLLAGCPSPGEEVEVTYLNGFHFEWDLFNHRLSHMTVVPDGDEVALAVVGGASTTSRLPDLAEGCERATCAEFPFSDDVDVEASWTRVRTTRPAGSATAEVLASSSGETAQVTVDLSEGDAGEVFALIAGLSIDTDHPHDGVPGCYLPSLGWHPKAIEVEVTDVEVNPAGDRADVTVSARFVAGNSMEDERECIDAVNEGARVPFAVSVVVLSAEEGVKQHTFERSEAWELGEPLAPTEQIPGQPEDVGIPEAHNVVGWRSLKWAYNLDDTDERGAYIRSLGFHADSTGSSTGYATNYSPGTQLTGFSYAFEGVVSSGQVEGETRSFSMAERLVVEVDESYVPVVVTRKGS
jgi:hypothetical protein